MNRDGLIFPMLAEIARWVGTARQDPDFREPIRDGAGTGGPGLPAEAHAEPYLLPCQVEPGLREAAATQPNGEAPEVMLQLLFSRSGKGQLLMPRRRDRLLTLRNPSGDVVHDYRGSDGVYATETQALNVANFRGRKSTPLWQVTFRSRSSGARRGL